MAFSMSRGWSDAIGLVRERWAALLAITVAMHAIALLTMLPFLPLWRDLLQVAADPQVQAQRIMEVWPRIMAMSMLGNIAQLVGYGALVALLSPERPAIGPALVRGLKAAPTAFVAFVFLFVGLYVAMLAVVLVVVVVVVALLAATGGMQGGAAGAMAAPAILLLMVLYVGVLIGLLYLGLRFVVLLPIIVLERVHNPFTVLARAWHLTRADSWKILGFWVLMWIAISIVFGTVMLAVAGSLIRLDGPPPTLETLAPLWLAMIPLNIVMMPLLIAMVVATYEQLAAGDAPPPEPVA
jgi:hypothetical protein